MKTKLLAVILVLWSACCGAQQAPTTESEPNNTPATATNLLTLPTASGAMTIHLTADSIQYYGDVDCYRVKILRAGVLTASIPSNVSGFTYHIDINDSSTGKLIHVVPVFINCGNTPRNVVVIPAGTWTISVRQNGGLTDCAFKQAPYDLDVSLDTSEQYEWNNDHSSLSTANALSAPVPQNAVIQGYISGYYYHSLSGSDKIDKDYYKIEMKAAGPLTATIPANMSNIQLSVELEDSTYSYVNGSTQTASVAGGSVSATYTLSKGIWYIKVSSASLNTSDQPYTLILGNTTGMPAAVNESKIAVSPNPGTGSFLVNIPGNPTRGNLTVTDIFGKTLLRTGITGGRMRIQLPDAPSGCYFLQVSVNGAVYSEKLLVK